MQKQKTIAKWLTVVLLSTVIVACYIVLSTVLKNDKTPSPKLTDAGTTEQPEPTPVHTPIYNTLPRNGEDFHQTKVHHFGGEDNDSLENMLIIGTKCYILCRFESKELDSNDSGIYLCCVVDDVFTSSYRISGLEQSICDITLSASGICVLTESQTNSHIYLFSTDGEIIACNNIDKFENASLFLWEASLWLFGSKNGRVSAVEIFDDLKIDIHNHILHFENAEIKEIIPRQDKLILFLQSSDNQLKIASFSKNLGFVNLASLKDAEFKKLNAIFTQNGINYILLSKQRTNFLLTSFDSSFEIQNSTLIQNVNDCCMLTSNNQIVIVATNKIMYYCNLLIKQSTSSIPINLDNFVYSSSNPSYKMFATQNNGKFEMFILEDTLTITKIYSLNATTENVKISSTKSADFIGFTSSTAENVLHMNFGMNDAFLLKYAKNDY